MPNWCKNNIKFEGDKLEIKRLKRMCRNRAGGFTFDKLVPEPLALKDTVSPVKEPNLELIEAYGADNWYDWRIKNWGCKWDATETEWMKTSDGFDVSFETPWGIPTEFYKRLSAEFPSVNIRVQFSNEFEGEYPLGEINYQNGTEYGCTGPMEGSPLAEAFAREIWMKRWTPDWEQLEPLEEEEEE